MRRITPSYLNQYKKWRSQIPKNSNQILITKINNMDKELQKLHQVFNTSNTSENDVKEEFFIDGINRLNQSLGTSIEPSTKAEEEIINLIYERDHTEALKLLLTSDIGFGFDLDYCENEFEKADWIDDDDDDDDVDDDDEDDGDDDEDEDEDDEDDDENEYGGEGYQYYHIYTKTKIHVFSELRPFPEGIEYVETKERFRK